MKIIPNMWIFAEACKDEPTGAESLFSKSIFIPMKNNLDFGYLAEFENRIIICFEGTKNIKAWQQTKP